MEKDTTRKNPEINSARKAFCGKHNTENIIREIQHGKHKGGGNLARKTLRGKIVGKT